MTMPSKRLIAALTAAACLGATTSLALGSSPQPAPKTTLAAVEEEVMCTVCGVPLSMAREAPAAKRERALIRDLIAQGKSKQEIKDELVATYGSGVLMLPGSEGFDLAAWLVPLALLLAGTIALAVVLVSWKRRGASGSTDRDAAPVPLSADDADLVDSALRERD